MVDGHFFFGEKRNVPPLKPSPVKPKPYRKQAVQAEGEALEDNPRGSGLCRGEAVRIGNASVENTFLYIVVAKSGRHSSTATTTTTTEEGPGPVELVACTYLVLAYDSGSGRDLPKVPGILG